MFSEVRGRRAASAAGAAVLGFCVLGSAVLAAGAGLIWPLHGPQVRAVQVAGYAGGRVIEVTVSAVPRGCTTRIAALDTSVTAGWSGGTVHALLTPTLQGARAGAGAVDVPVVVTTGGCLRATRTRVVVRTFATQ